MDRYVAILYVRPPTPQILDFGGGFWILDFGDFGLWILGILDFGDFGFWILGIWILDFGDFGFWIFGILGILDFGFWILDFGFWGFWILDFGDFGFWILDFGDFGFWIFGILGILDFWIFGTLCSRSLCAKFGFWNLGILDFGFGFWILGILDFGFWGSWVLDFGLGILDGHLVTKFWMLHKKRRLCTPNRVGGFLRSRVVNHNLVQVSQTTSAKTTSSKRHDDKYLGENLKVGSLSCGISELQTCNVEPFFQ